ncbi:alpha/beta fold hydrolase [Geobacter sp.]|uniref:alpha/beta fold hydrolase n=1 Tax=Geobacter sp. TaxID=46610 RepID=UPI00261A9306|nr:alpha/beta fold hydrolase [Geobacter sp.]
MGALIRHVFLVLLDVLTFGRVTSSPPPEPLDRTGTWGSDLPLPKEMAAALTKGEVTCLTGPGDFAIPVRIFGEGGALLPVLMTHGLQSHSGWFAQSAALLAVRGHPVYAFDRGGSGLSRAPRGDCKDFMAWAREIEAVAEEAMRRHGARQVYLLGHCFGAIPATVFASEHPDKIRALILTTPAIYTRTSLAWSQTLKILLWPAGRMDFVVPSPLETEWFSELEEYKRFIAADPLALRETTGDFCWQIYQARRHLKANTERLTMPIFVALAGKDPISDVEKNSAWFQGLPSVRKLLVRYDDARHVLEFSPERDRFFSDLGRWLASLEEP